MRPARPIALPSRAGEHGFSLLELAIASAILLVALLVASELLVESGRRLASGARELRRPEATLALRLLRDDLRAAEPVAGWGGTELVCRRPEQTVRWEVAGERLVRRVYDLLGNDLGARPMLDEVIAFRWRPLDGTAIEGAAIEVEIVRRRADGGAGLRAGTTRWRAEGETLESARIVAGSRLAAP